MQPLLMNLGIETLRYVADELKKPGKALAHVVTDYLTYLATNHPHAVQQEVKCNQPECPAKDFTILMVIEITGSDANRTQKFTVLSSPYERMDGFTAGPYSDRTAAGAKKQCMTVIAAKAHQVYHEGSDVPTTTLPTSPTQKNSGQKRDRDNGLSTEAKMALVGITAITAFLLGRATK